MHTYKNKNRSANNVNVFCSCLGIRIWIWITQALHLTPLGKVQTLRRWMRVTIARKPEMRVFAGRQATQHIRAAFRFDKTIDTCLIFPRRYSKRTVCARIDRQIHTNNRWLTTSNNNNSNNSIPKIRDIFVYLF